MITQDIWEFAITCLHQGKIIAYPTEAVYGLGCDPFKEEAVLTLLRLKDREISKGLILIASEWQQIEPLIQTLPDDRRHSIRNTWPGPITWVFPASSQAPPWITGNHTSIAIRLTDHPIAKELCSRFGAPIVSTSANRAGHPPLKKADEVGNLFGKEISLILPGNIGDLAKPTPIRDALTGDFLRGR